jgi:FkbM family methyltransferase
MSSLGNFRELKEKLLYTLHYIVHLLTYKIPYYGLYKLITCLGGDKVWYKFPVKDFYIPKLMPDGNRVVLRWRDHGAAWRIYHNSLYDKFFKPEKGDVVVDAGAHVGVYSLRAAKLVGNNGLVIAIEPAKENYRILLKNISINSAHNIIPIKVGLWSSRGKAKLYIKESSMSHSLFKDLGESFIVRVEEVYITTLDHLLKELGVDHVDILKINVEGAELEVLKGAKEVLTEKSVFKIVITTHPPHEEISRAIVRYLISLGYNVKVIKLEGGMRVIYATIKPL